MIAQTVSDSIQHLLKCCFESSSCQLHHFGISHIFLLIHSRCHCVFNSHSENTSFSYHIILNPFRFLLVTYNVYFSCRFPPKASFWIMSGTMLQRIRFKLLRSCSCLHSLDDIIVCIAILNFQLYQQQLAERFLFGILIIIFWVDFVGV